MNGSDDIRWAYAQRIAYALGLLEPEDEARFARILDQHPDLRNTVTTPNDSLESAIGTSGESTVAHIPDEILGRWPQPLERTRGTKRQLLEGHLERCPECRDALDMLSAVSTSVAAKPKPLTVADRSRAAAATDLRRRPGSRSRVRPAVIGWVWGAVATAALLWVTLAPESVENEPAPLVVPRTTRDAPLATTTEANQAAVLLRIPPSLAGEPEAHITITSPDGTVALTSSGTPRDLDETVILVHVKEPGSYRVRYTGTNTEGIPVDTWFRIEAP